MDNEDQNLLPNLLLFVLALLWSERMDWYFGVDMAVYHTTGVSPKVPVVPDAFLSLGVERRKESLVEEEPSRGRLSYAVWEESGVVPVLALEIVSQTPGSEYSEKFKIYERLGILYYVIYNPVHWQRDRHQPYEVYKLVNGSYQLQIGEPFWMPEVGLGIGRARQPVGGIELEVLAWHDEQGKPYPVPEEELEQLRAQLQAMQGQVEQERQRAEQQSQRAEQAQERARRLAERLRELGIDPDEV